MLLTSSTLASPFAISLTALTMPLFSFAIAESTPSHNALLLTAKAAPQAAAPGPQTAPATADRPTTVLLVAPVIWIKYLYQKIGTCTL